jgi:hypothetical protein
MAFFKEEMNCEESSRYTFVLENRIFVRVNRWVLGSNIKIREKNKM